MLGIILFSCKKQEQNLPFKEPLLSFICDSLISYGNKIKYESKIGRNAILVEIENKKDTTYLSYTLVNKKDTTWNKHIVFVKKVANFTIFFIDKLYDGPENIQYNDIFKEVNDEYLIDYYPMRMSIFKKKIIGNYNIPIQEMKWVIPKIENKKFIPSKL